MEHIAVPGELMDEVGAVHVLFAGTGRDRAEGDAPKIAIRSVSVIDPLLTLVSMEPAKDWEEQAVETRLARIVRTRRDLMEIRYKPGVTMDIAGVKEIHGVRKHLFGDQPHASISLIPDDVDFELAVTQQDHYSANRSSDPLFASAVVARGSLLDMIAKLYFSYFPQTFPVLTTNDEVEARAWIAAQLDRNTRSAG
jgi:hypothetical protein